MNSRIRICVSGVIEKKNNFLDCISFFFTFSITCRFPSNLLNHILSYSQWEVVSSWDYPKEEMVAYRSFRPFFPLLAVHQVRAVLSVAEITPHFAHAQEEAVQLWAVWAIHHVCTKNASRFVIGCSCR